MLRIRIRNVADRISYPQLCNSFGTMDVHYMLRMLRIMEGMGRRRWDTPPPPWGGFRASSAALAPLHRAAPPHRGNCDRYDPVADRAALHVVADPRAAEHDLSGRLLSSRTQPSANRAATILRVAAMSLGRGSTALGAFYRRLAARVGKAKAITATARKLAILLYRMLKGELQYDDPGADAYNAQHTLFHSAMNRLSRCPV